MPPDAIHEALANARRALLTARGPHGHWEGELSTSALSTATAAFALSLAGARPDLIARGLRWLAEHQNPDGGWGDTTLSLSNISTTALCWAAFGVPEAKGFDAPVSRAEGWLRAAAGSLEPLRLARAIADRYGKDRTFSVPILTMLALAGRLGPGGWRLVPQLPFELAACPFEWFQLVRLPVVSYALPALVAIGLVRHRRRPTWNLPRRWLRDRLTGRTLRLLRGIQPAGGGFLEATPLTSFVTMSLIAAGERESPVVAEGLAFLERSVRPDGSWPIDTNLATWVTTLSVNALDQALPEPERAPVRDWLLGQQYRTQHPYTRAAPGGWAWTDLPGGVPDADDTAGALLALAKLGRPAARTVEAARAGVRWLLDLQNADGGIPTFCRGWTGLPFDRSSNDLTAHAILAFVAWMGRFDVAMSDAMDRAVRRGVDYLMRTQRADGAWAPLWFGNQHAAGVENLTYGTSRVLRVAGVRGQLKIGGEFSRRLNAGRDWLLANQNPDGGWGGRAGTPSSVEETALALEGLAAIGDESPAIGRGVGWLIERTGCGREFPPSPIGFYFANLWYFERLYPLVFTTAALSAVAPRVARL